MENEKIEFAFEKKLGIAECLYGDVHRLIWAIEKLFQCMKETNKNHGVESEFFRLDFRGMDAYEQITNQFPLGALVLDMKWGSKKEIEKKNLAEKSERS